MSLADNTSKWSMTATNISAIVAAVGAIIAGMYGIAEHFHTRQLQSAREVMQEVMAESDLVTGAQFAQYVQDQTTHRTTVEAVMLGYMEEVQGSLLIYLPALAESDAQIIRRMDLIETKLDTRSLDPIELRLERMWRHMEEQARTDSAKARHQEIMNAVRRINAERYQIPLKSGDRSQ